MGGDPGFIIFIGLFGSPPLVLWVIGLVQMISGGFEPAFTKLGLRQKFTTLASLVMIIALSCGCFWFIREFVHELNIQLTCARAGCAQTGLFFFMYVPLPWISFVFAWVAVIQLIDGGALPLRRKPNFSLRPNRRQ